MKKEKSEIEGNKPSCVEMMNLITLCPMSLSCSVVFFYHHHSERRGGVRRGEVKICRRIKV